MDDTSLTLSGLFFSSLLAATILPGGSEGVLVWLHQQQQHGPMLLLFTATVGNTIGGMSSWALGHYGLRRWSPQQADRKLSPRAQRWITQYGASILLLSWLPLIGDALCLAAGWFRIHWLPSLLYIGTGKAVRYALLLFAIN